MPRILITIPAYNEEKSIGRVINDLQDAIHSRLLGVDYRIVVVSDGSTDKTVEEARKAGAVVCVKDHSGLAETFRFEMSNALEMQAEYIVHTDADGQYRPVDVCYMIEAIQQGEYDLLLGNRFASRIKHMPVSKKVLNRILGLMFSVLMHRAMPDIGTGLRAFTPAVARLPMYSHHTYTMEQIVKAWMSDMRIGYLPIIFRARRDGGSRLMTGAFNHTFKTIINLPKVFRK